ANSYTMQGFEAKLSNHLPIDAYTTAFVEEVFLRSNFVVSMKSIRDMKDLIALKKLLQGSEVCLNITIKIPKKMARQKGIIKLKGKIGDLSFYKTQDGHLAREK